VIAQFNGNWSFSWLMKYESCAHLFKLGKIDKLPQLEPEKDNPLERGNRVHKCYELYIKGESDLFDEEAKCSGRFRPASDHLRTLFRCGMASVEEDWLFDHDWNPTDKKFRCPVHAATEADALVSRFDPECEQCRRQLYLWAKLDACVFDKSNKHAICIDFKTGKSQYKAIEHVQQLQLYAALAALKCPWADRITVELWYLDEGHVRQAEYTREEALKFIGRFDQRAQRIYNDRLFRPNPNKITCAYCPYGPRRGTGACPVGV